MNPKIKEIIQILETLSTEIDKSNEEILFSKEYSSLELPEIISSIVDLLQPQLYPYEYAIYMYLFKNSIVRQGIQFIRVSTRSLQNGIIVSASGQSASLSYDSVKTSIDGLEKKGAISKQGDTNREGTLYKVNIPDEIEICQTYLLEIRSKMQSPDLKEIKDNEIDFYNIKENRFKIFERDQYKCAYCGKQLTRFSATLDHIQPVSRGGDNSYDNLKTACLHCNSTRGNKAISEFLIEG